MASNIDVYTVLDCWLEVSSIGKLPVSAFTLITRHNDIPSIQLDVDPLHKIFSETVTTPDTPDVASFDVFIKRYIAVQSIITSETRTANFKCDIECTNPQKGARAQKLDLKDWIVHDAGFVGTASGGLQLRIRIAHPLSKIVETTANFFGAGTEEKVDPAVFDGQKNVLAGIAAGMKLYHTYMTESAVGPLKDDPEFKTMLAQYAEAREALVAHMVWVSPESSRGWPSVALGALDQEVPLTIWSYVNTIGPSTFWSWLSDRIVNDYHLSITPTFWAPAIEIGPNRFWAEPKMVLADYHIMSFELPPSDPMPVRGVYALFNSPEEVTATTYTQAEGMKEVLADGTLYAEKTLPGLIPSAQAPAWMTMLLSHRGARFGRLTSFDAFGNDMTSFINSDSGLPGLGETPVAQMAQLRTALKALCKQQFTEYYRSRMEVSLRCSLIIQTDTSALVDNYVTAGMVIRVLPDPAFWKLTDFKQGELMDFFATEVIHRVDCVNGAAYTTIRGSFMHESEGPKNIEAIVDGIAKNYLYEQEKE